jgi:hypothetical protein
MATAVLSDTSVTARSPELEISGRDINEINSEIIQRHHSTHTNKDTDMIDHIGHSCIPLATHPQSPMHTTVTIEFEHLFGGLHSTGRVCARRSIASLRMWRESDDTFKARFTSFSWHQCGQGGSRLLVCHRCSNS